MIDVSHNLDVCVHFSVKVRNLEAERVARKQSVMQLATLHTVCAVGFLDVGVQLALADKGGVAAVAFIAAFGFTFLVRQVTHYASMPSNVHPMYLMSPCNITGF